MLIGCPVESSLLEIVVVGQRIYLTLAETEQP